LAVERGSVPAWPVIGPTLSALSDPSEMASVLTIGICIFAAAAIVALRREFLTLGHAIGRSILEFKAMLKQIDDDLWRR
jgi:hypothetical protein